LWCKNCGDVREMRIDLRCFFIAFHCFSLLFIAFFSFVFVPWRWRWAGHNVIPEACRPAGELQFLGHLSSPDNVGDLEVGHADRTTSVIKPIRKQIWPSFSMG
jgi:hypothetical protein